MKRLLQGLFYRFVALRRDERGYAVMATLAIFLFLFVLCAAVYAVGETIHERIKIQNACDAAAYSAAAVQADGLSRMACVNRAMSWTYVQMSNRQMDYITYRWLKLTQKRFEEDAQNANDYAAQLVLAADPRHGIWAILEAVVSGAISILANFDCATGGHASKKNGLACWTGLSAAVGIEDKNYNQNQSKVKLNRYEIPFSLKGLVQSPMALFSENFPKKLLDQVVTLASVFGTGDKPEDWGAILGILIDYDKKNIYQMNRSLSRINYEMTRSMRETAENILKASLTDNRLPSQESLSDYYVSISIPYARNPYPSSQGAETNGNVKSYFSPLRNTEVDERLFLQMNTTNHADKALASHFTKLLFGNSSTAFGIDQWFIRGKGKYFDMDNLESDDDWQVCRNDGQVDLWMKRPAKKTFDGGQSGWLMPDADDLLAVGPRIDNARLTGTDRSKGEFGVQRVYKDANLNETDAGFPPLRHKANRGNHLLDAMDLAKAGLSMFKKFFFKSGDEDIDNDDESDDDDGDGGDGEDDGAENVSDIESLKKQIKDLDDTIKGAEYTVQSWEADKAKLDPEADADEIKRIQGLIDDTNTKILAWKSQKADLEATLREAEAQMGNLPSGNESLDDGNDDGSNEEGRPAASGDHTFGKLIGTFFNAVLSHYSGKFLDITPSCGNNKKDTFVECQMCRKANDTTALYADYRWGACKYYCLTKPMTYVWTLVWGYKKRGGELYSGIHHLTSRRVAFCDTTHSHLFKKINLGIKKIKITGSGFGHYGFPKWFCGTKPKYAGDSYFGKSLAGYLLKYFPPLAPEDIKGNCHGYMKDTWDMGNDGFLKPVKPLWSKKVSYSRDGFCSCAPFIDGAFRYARGSDSAAGLIRGHARIYGDDKEIFDNRYVGAKCMPWVLNEKFFAGDGTIVVGAAKKFYNPFSQLFGFLGNEKQIADIDQSVLSAFKIPKNNYMWTMSAARAGVRRRRRNGQYDKERMYQITYDSAPDAENLRYHGDVHMMLSGDGKVPTRAWDVKAPVPVWDGCVCRAENKSRFESLWNLCESDWDATLLPLRYSRVRAAPRIKPSSDDLEAMGAGTNWVWSVMPTSGQLSLDPYSNPFIGSWWKRATDKYFNLLDMEWRQSTQFLPEANKLPGESSEAAAWRYWNMMQQNRIL